MYIIQSSDDIVYTIDINSDVLATLTSFSPSDANIPIKFIEELIRLHSREFEQVSDKPLELIY